MFGLVEATREAGVGRLGVAPEVAPGGRPVFRLAALAAIFAAAFTLTSLHARPYLPGVGTVRSAPGEAAEAYRAAPWFVEEGAGADAAEALARALYMRAPWSPASR